MTSYSTLLFDNNLAVFFCFHQDNRCVISIGDANKTKITDGMLSFPTVYLFRVPTMKAKARFRPTTVGSRTHELSWKVLDLHFEEKVLVIFIFCLLFHRQSSLRQTVR